MPYQQTATEYLSYLFVCRAGTKGAPPYQPRLAGRGNEGELRNLRRREVMNSGCKCLKFLRVFGLHTPEGMYLVPVNVSTHSKGVKAFVCCSFWCKI